MGDISKIFRALKFFIIGLIVLVFLLVFSIYWECSLRPKFIRNDSKEKLLQYDRLIQDEIPNGSSIMKVGNFLSSHKAHQSNYRIIDNDKKMGYDPLEDLNFPNKDQIIEGYIIGSVGKVTHSCLVSCDLMMNFYFDNNHKLVTHTINWGCTGP